MRLLKIGVCSAIIPNVDVLNGKYHLIPHYLPEKVRPLVLIR